jgi:phosphoglycolate phosphatase/putative hydrolase of the HAD superfamily
MPLFSRNKQQNQFLNLEWQKIEAVIFDVDGTLYDQRKLRRLMVLEILRYYLINPGEMRDIKIILNFRREREKRSLDATIDLENSQYNWAAEASGVSSQRVRHLVQKWIFKAPLKHLPSCRYPGLVEFFDNLSQRGIATGVFSDYPAQDKLTRLEIFPDCIVSATDKNVDKLKPSPKGLLVVTEMLGVSVENCLFIGDRFEGELSND